MREIRWLQRRIVDAIHDEQIREHGGQSGLRDENLLEFALSRPQQRHTYEPESDLESLAAAYGYGLANNHAYLDGNKRIAFMAMYVFLGLNGHEIVCGEPEAVSLMVGVADSSVDEDGLADGLRAHIAAENPGD